MFKSPTQIVFGEEKKVENIFLFTSHLVSLRPILLFALKFLVCHSKFASGVLDIYSRFKIATLKFACPRKKNLLGKCHNPLT